MTQIASIKNKNGDITFNVIKDFKSMTKNITATDLIIYMECTNSFERHNLQKPTERINRKCDRFISIEEF